jgi:LysM repeat protein
MRTLTKIFRSILVSLILSGTLFVSTRVAQAEDIFSSSYALQSNVSSVSVLGGKNNNTDLSSNDNIISDNNALTPNIGPMGVSDGKDTPDPSTEDTSVYVVRQGDSLAAIAKMFGVSVDTILWANDMKTGDKLTPGDVLLILPISGLEHTVVKGQTLQSIAKLYKVDVNDIIQNNDITLDTPLAIGDTLIIPNASKSEESGTPVKDTKASATKDNQYYQNHPIKNLAGYYVNPVPGYRKSQGIHDKNAIDMAIAKGTSVHAAASGTVTLARLGYNGGFGGLVIISHPNGTETLYAHLSKLSTYTGEKVSQGEVIASSGGVPGTPYAGHTTGAHLHFEVHGARNPGADGSWAN